MRGIFLVTFVSRGGLGNRSPARHGAGVAFGGHRRSGGQGRWAPRYPTSPAGGEDPRAKAILARVPAITFTRWSERCFGESVANGCVGLASSDGSRKKRQPRGSLPWVLRRRTFGLALLWRCRESAWASDSDIRDSSLVVTVPAPPVRPLRSLHSRPAPGGHFPRSLAAGNATDVVPSDLLEFVIHPPRLRHPSHRTSSRGITACFFQKDWIHRRVGNGQPPCRSVATLR